MQHGHSGGQCIHCTVDSCKYNHHAKKACTLDSINVCPVKQKNSGSADESMCGSYEH